jgi:23S rRNA G2445 N2-methylase RlmL
VLLSVAGAPLWRRGYRARLHARAPLREDLAQAAIRAVYIAFPPDLPATGTHAIDPRPQTLFVPFSGTGTFLFEWLLCHFAIAPALFERAYDFQSFAAGVPPSVSWLTRRLAAMTAERLAASGPVRARLVDLSREAMEGARESFGRFGDAAGRVLPVSVDWIVGDAFEAPWERFLADAEGDLFIALNPPYGRRLAARASAPGGAAESTGDAETPGAAAQGREHRGTAELYRKIGESCEALARAWADRAAGTNTARAALPAANGVSLLATGRGAARIRGCILCPSETSWSAFVKATPAFQNRTSHFSQGGIDVRLCVFAAPAQR